MELTKINLGFFKKGKVLNIKTAVAAISLLCIPAAASAVPVTGQISLNGYAEAVGSVGFGSATGIDFANGTGTSVSGTSGALANYGGGTGSFAALGPCAGGSCGTIKDIASFATSGPISSFITFTTGGPAVSFDLATITSVAHNTGADSLSFTAVGTIDFTGFDPTAATFSLSAQGDDIKSFSATVIAQAVPEPSTWALMLLGFAGIGFMGYRRRKLIPVAA
jgi:PEP-CTERM motif